MGTNGCIFRDRSADDQGIAGPLVIGRQWRAAVGRGLNNLSVASDDNGYGFAGIRVNEWTAVSLVGVWKILGLLLLILRWSRRVAGLFQRPDQLIEIFVRR